MTDKELMKHCKEKNALSYNDIKNMSQEELDNLISVCWHDSQYNGGCNKKSLRCWDRGIIDLGLVTLNSRGNTAYVISWSDFSGGPEVEVSSLDEKIHMSGDGEWDYGLYKSENQVKLENRDNKIQEILN
jgi:hypothetical protein